MTEFFRNLKVGDALDLIGSLGITGLFEDRAKTPTPSSPRPETSSTRYDLGKLGRRFQLKRHEDASGVSGVGSVATGIEFPDGQVALRWNTSTASTGIYKDILDVIAIHGHGGMTQIEWID